jgi:hypothetical protein
MWYSPRVGAKAKKVADNTSTLLTVRMSRPLKAKIDEIARAAMLSPSTVAKNILESTLRHVDDRLDIAADRARVREMERRAEEAKMLWRQRAKELEEYARSVAEKLESAGLIKRMEPRLDALIRYMKSRSGSAPRRRSSRS